MKRPVSSVAHWVRVWPPHQHALAAARRDMKANRALLSRRCALCLTDIDWFPELEGLGHVDGSGNCSAENGAEQAAVEHTVDDRPANTSTNGTSDASEWACGEGNDNGQGRQNSCIVRVSRTF